MNISQILDVVGLRTPYQIEMNSYQQTGNPDAKLIADKLKEMIDAGQTGRESGQGFYHYPNPEFLAPDFLKTRLGKQSRWSNAVFNFSVGTLLALNTKGSMRFGSIEPF